MRRESGSKAWIVSQAIFMISSDHQSNLITVSTLALGKLPGSLTFFLPSSLKLWKTLKTFSCCNWSLFLLSKISLATLHTSSSHLCIGLCLSSLSSYLFKEGPCCHFLVLLLVMLMLLLLVLLLVLLWLLHNCNSHNRLVELKRSLDCLWLGGRQSGVKKSWRRD